MSTASAGQNQADRGSSRLLPSSITEQQFGKVYVRDDGDQRHVEFTVWLQELDGVEAENWQTGVALDASASMKNWYGRNLQGSVPPEAIAEYEKKGYVMSVVEDGVKVQRFRRAAHKDALKRGFVKPTDNVVEDLARDFVSYLARELDEDGGTTVIYWACGDGSAYEVMGDFTEDECRSLKFVGPQQVAFGDKTHLLPAVKYFLDRFRDAPRGLYVFLTDGRLDDMDELKDFTRTCAQQIEAGQRNSVKCVLIGVGSKVDEAQMQELDDLDTSTNVDIWDYKIAAELRAISEIIVELVDENRIVASSAIVFDDANNEVCHFSDGLPARASFSMPQTSRYFELEVAGKRFRQPVVEASDS